MVDANQANERLNAQYDPSVSMNMAVYRPATFDLGNAITRALPIVEMSMGMAMCSALSSSFDEEMATPTEAIKAKRYGGAVNSRVFCES